jgi:hypothetical protein
VFGTIVPAVRQRRGSRGDRAARCSPFKCQVQGPRVSIPPPVVGKRGFRYVQGKGMSKRIGDILRTAWVTWITQLAEDTPGMGQLTSSGMGQMHQAAPRPVWFNSDAIDRADGSGTASPSATTWALRTYLLGVRPGYYQARGVS